jgi:3',5'-cyclic AMP phosphodiesterase CpdA
MSSKNTGGAKLAFFLIFLFFSSPADGNSKSSDFFSQKIRFAVISDPHLYNPTLGMTGQAFENAMVSEIKLFRYGKELLEAAFLEVEKADIDFLIIPGDLTKDGELLSHLKMAKYLRLLRNKGIFSFVVPGNHDINNPDATSYEGKKPVPTETVSPQEFAHIYNEFGYGDALFRDPHSLSYVVEPVDGFWLLAMDSCKYEQNTDKSIVGGAFSAETMEWISRMLIKAHRHNKMVVGFMHHAVFENFIGHAELLPDFIIDNYETVARIFARYGLQMVFTGHTHIQDITGKQWDDRSFLLDIQTGSILSYPHPYRIVTIKKGFVRINSRFIYDIPGEFGNKTFYEYSRSFTENSARQLAREFGLFGNIADLFVNAYMAHLVGDEQSCEQILQRISELKSSQLLLFRTAGYYLASVWTDLKPPDNNLIFMLPSGAKKTATLMGNTWKTFRELNK